jgi:beta-glucoside operon transcriptional antiterminator
VDPKYYGLLKEIPQRTLTLVDRMIQVAETKLQEKLNPNLVFILADHVNFAAIREKKGMNVALPYSYELEYEYPEYIKIAKWMIKNINANLHTRLHKGEVTSIAMHLLNAREGVRSQVESTKEEDLESRSARVIQKMTELIESFFSVQVEKDSFHYFRFKNHVKYFVQRKVKREEFCDGNHELYESIRQAYPQVSECVNRIDDYILEEFQERCSEDELLYLIVHVNRLYTKEDCNRKGITSEEQ